MRILLPVVYKLLIHHFIFRFFCVLLAVNEENLYF